MLSLKVDICFFKVAEETLSLAVFGSFSQVSYSLFKISEDPFGGGETRKVSPKVFVFDFFFGLIVGLYQYMIYNILTCLSLFF